MSDNFGIYIKTFQPDYYLCRVLIASLREFAPDVDITVIADADYDRDRIFGCKVLKMQDPFLKELKFFLRKFWVFFGPYDRFLYLDADQIALRPLDNLLNEIKNRDFPFIIANESGTTTEILKTGDKELLQKQCKQRMGDLSLYKELDSNFDWRQILPINSGNYASHRGFIPYDLFKKTIQHSELIHKRKGIPVFNNRRLGILGRDQGLTNYFIFKSNTKPILKGNLYGWGGVSEKEFKLRDSEKSFYFIHWAGCPRPTFLRRKVPAGKDWIRFYYDYFKNSEESFLKNTIKNIYFDLRKRVYNTGRKIKNIAR